MMYLVVASTISRFKYYHAWLLADAICNASGLGFNGYDAKGRARWDLISNVDILKFEVSLSHINIYLFLVSLSYPDCNTMLFWKKFAAS
jgi:hypothetical protein